MNYEDYKQLISQRMGERRYIHSVNVAKQAKLLAEKFGCDADKAVVAGILHDVTKETPPEEQLALMNNGGIVLNEVERCGTKLWHSVSGAVYVRDVLKIDDEDIFNAIRYHTTGRAGMSLLEKVIFVADFTGEERDYRDVDIMREKALRDLDEAMLYGLQFTIKDLASRSMAIHPNAIACYNELILEGR